MVVIETPKLNHNKYKYDERREVFILNAVLPEGMSFPYDFGFLPSTLGDDGDPVDVLLLTEQPTFSGCVVPSRLIGEIEARQTEKDDQSERNDRLVAVPLKARNYAEINSVKDLDKHLLDEIEQSFISHDRIEGKRFKVLGLHGPDKVEELARRGIKLFKKRHQKWRADRNENQSEVHLRG